MAFWRDTVVDGSILAKWNSALGRRGAKARLAHLLCEMGIRFENVGLGKHDDFDFPITQAQLADVLGVTAVHLNRTIQALRMDGLLVTRGSQYHLPDPKRLRQLAQFDPSYLLLGREARPSHQASTTRSSGWAVNWRTMKAMILPDDEAERGPGEREQEPFEQRVAMSDPLDPWWIIAGNGVT